MMKPILFCCFILMQYINAFAQPMVMWTRSYPDSVGGATLIDAIKDNSNNVIVAGSRPNYSNNGNIDPFLLKYDAAGNLILFWSHSDSIINEIPTQVASDSLNNLYVLTLAFGSSQDTVKLIKLDGSSGQEIFNYTLGTGIYPGAMGIHHQYLYVALGLPNLQVFKYDSMQL